MDNQDEVNQSNEENLEEIENLDNGENLNQEYQQPVPRELTEKVKAQKAGRDVAEIAAKSFAQAYGGDLGSKAVDAVLKTKGGQKVLDSASKKLNRSPVTKKLLSKAEPAISEAKPQINQAVQGLAGGSSTGPKQNEFMNRKGSNIPSLGASNSSLEDNETSTSAESNKKGDGFSLMPKMPGVSSGKGDLDEFKKKADLIQFFIKYKWPILIGIGIFFLFAIIISFYYTDDSSRNKSKLFGLNGYQYIEVETLCETVRVENPDTHELTRELDFETEYIPGVVNAEVGAFTDAPEVLKLFAIAARSYAIHNMQLSSSVNAKSCTLVKKEVWQAFTFDKEDFERITQDNHPIMQAVQATYGLVVVNNEQVVQTRYDSTCYCGEDENNYFIGYAGDFAQKADKHCGQTQSIPKSWAQNYREPMRHINNSKSDNKTCSGNHGGGISQYGSYYLAKEKNYDLYDLLDFYIGEFLNGYELYSLYPGFNTNYTTTTSSGATNQLTKTLREALADKGIAVEEFNEYLLKNIMDAGFGTRDAVVAAALTITADLEQKIGVRLPYTYSGQHGGSYYLQSGGTIDNPDSGSFYGIDPNWGARIHHVDSSFGLYQKYGPDCSGFVAWALTNGGFKFYSIKSTSYLDLGTNYNLDGDRHGDPGDLIAHPGHVMLIVGVDDTTKQYYVAEASGRDNGVQISTRSFNLGGADKIVKMDNYYESHKSTMSADEFIAQYRAGYLEPYTGQYDTNFNFGTITKDSTYFVGDSRTVGVCTSASICNGTTSCDTNSCLALNGSGSSWLSQNLTKINNVNAHNIVINLGVNDLTGNPNTETLAQTYFNYYESIAKNNPNKIIYITSVGPVGNGSVSKTSVESFNTNIKKLIDKANRSNLEYLNTYSTIQYDIGSDGIHYNNDTYKRIYDYVMGEI